MKRGGGAAPTVAAVSLLAFVGALLAIAPASAAVSVTDASGHTVTLAEPARRVVSLAPHLTELLFAVGAGERIVGASSFSDYPAAAREIPRVGDYRGVDYERLLALRPDLVVAWRSGNGAATIERLRELGLTVYVSEPRELQDIAAELERLGRLTGRPAAGARAAIAFRERRTALAGRYAGRSPVTVFYEIWHDPLITVNGEHLISEVIRLCGGRNAFADLAALAPRVGLEAVLAADPEVIVAGGGDGGRPGWLDDWRRWPSLAAVARGNLFFVPPDLMQRHTPRILDAAAILCRDLDEARRP